MQLTFSTLCKNLNLTESYSLEQFDTLKLWCQQHISQDISYEGTENEQYSLYLKLASSYLDVFLKNLPDSLEQKVDLLGSINPIQYAALKGYDRFIEAQSDLSEQVINAEDKKKLTPLHHAALKGHFATVTILLKKGANSEKINQQQEYPIQSSLFLPFINSQALCSRKEEIFRVLRAKSPLTITGRDKAGNSILHKMALGHFDSLLEEVIQSHPDLVFSHNNALLYPIHTAILNESEDSARVLLKVKGVADLRDDKGQSPLHYAAQRGSKNMVLACCRATQDINILDHQHKTPLLCAAETGNKEAMDVLIRMGADKTILDAQGHAPSFFTMGL